jgi:integrase/recombinase XerC
MQTDFREYIKYIKYQRIYSDKTVTAYQKDLIQFESFLLDIFNQNKIIWSHVNKNIIRQFLAILNTSGLQRRSIARKIAALKSFFRFLSQRNVIASNPMLTIKTPKYDKKLPEFIPIQYIDELMDLPPENNFEGIRDRAILELFYGTGIRLSELLNMKFSSLMLTENLIRIIGKGEKERVVPIGKSASERLKNFLEIRPTYALPETEQLFVLKSGKKMYPMVVQRIVSKYLQEIAEIKKKSPHVLRHTFATHLMNQGADIRAIKDLLGHVNLSTTQIYTHISIDHLKSIYSRAHPGVTTTPHKNRRP